MMWYLSEIHQHTVTHIILRVSPTQTHTFKQIGYQYYKWWQQVLPKSRHGLFCVSLNMKKKNHLQQTFAI